MRNPRFAPLKKMVAAFLSFVMVVSLAATPCRAFAANEQKHHKEAQETILHDGIYEGSARGYSSVITVRVTITGGEIANVEVVSQGETEIYWNLAKAVIDSIISNKTADVDIVSGATYSSNGIINAVKNALEKSAAGPDADIDKPQASWFNGGTGTSKDPFQIANADQLMRFASSVDNQVNYAGYYVKLTSDIDLGKYIWNPVGSGRYAFFGTFNGGNHTVSNMTIGSKDTPYVFENEVQMVGFFGILGDTAVIKNLKLENIYVNTKRESGAFSVGGISGNFEPSKESEPLIDHCSVQGSITSNALKGNCFIGGITGRQVGGSIINSKSNVKLNGTSAYAYVEAGGITGMNNGGLIANCYTLGGIEANGNEGDTTIVAGGIAGLVQGDIVNCYEKGNIVSKLQSDCTGMIAGWHREGKGKIYNCFYNGKAKFYLNNTSVKKKAVGYTEEAAMDEEGLFYVGGLQMELKSYTASSGKTMAKTLNNNFSKFSIDIKNTWKLKAKALRKWKVKGKEVTFTNTYATVKYVQPESEKVPQKHIKMKDGTWYGRDEAKSSIVKITTVNDKVTKTKTLSGKSSGKGYKEAVKRAKDKARYGDTSNYEPIDVSRLGGGEGTKENPYLIANEAQLRYIAEAINEDVSWEGCYFRQTADITLGSEEWLPIGFAIIGFYKSRWQTFCEYPFRGNYDGANHTISGLKIYTGSKTSSDERKMFNAGLFGYTQGEVPNILQIEEGTRVVEIKNIKLDKVQIKTRAQTESYAGALIARAEEGVLVDNCSACGTVSAKTEAGDVYAGGLIAFPWLGGIVKNCYADVNVTAKVKKGDEAGTAYAGGLFGCDMRVTTLNSYATGDVTANGNKDGIYIGGVSGENAGAHYNTYATGSVNALTATKYIGALSGGMVGIGADYCGYYSSSAKITSGGKAVSPVSAYGETTFIGERADTVAMDSEKMTGSDFAKTLTDNIANVQDALKKMQAAMPERPVHTIYYTGDGSDLYSWTLAGGRVTQDIPVQEEP